MTERRSPSRYRVPLADLVAAARVAPDAQVLEQPALQVPADDAGPGDAVGMGMVRPPGTAAR